MRPERDCRLCGLHSGRTMMVLPCGDPSSKVCFVGEAPGEKEDLSGTPFVGRSGKLLDKMLAEEGVDRSSIRITNTVKCRPPGNRDPTADEMVACRPFLMAELQDCDAIVALGRSACRSLAGLTEPMKDIANKRLTIDVCGREILLIPTYHPAACIYRKEAREGLRETIRSIRPLV